jgi:hypothetical protein
MIQVLKVADPNSERVYEHQKDLGRALFSVRLLKAPDEKLLAL